MRERRYVVFDPAPFSAARSGEEGATSEENKLREIFHELPAWAGGSDAFKYVSPVQAEVASSRGLLTMPCPRMPIRLIQQVASGTEAGPGAPWGIAAIGADRAGLTGEGICVAVLDSGIDRTHPAFAGLIRDDNSNYKDFTGTGLSDKSGHGTHCAGIIFGRDVGGQIGVAPGITNVLVAKVADRDTVASTDQLNDALLWAVSNGANVVSMSIGLDFLGHAKDLREEGIPDDAALALALSDYREYAKFFDTLIAQATGAARVGRSALVVAAAGNDSHADAAKPYRIVTTLPAVATGVLAVGAVGRTADGKLHVAPFSNARPDVCAPGVGILSAAVGGGTVAMSGTSQATPHAAAAAALWFQKLWMQRGQRPDPADVRSQITATADFAALSPTFGIEDMGHGFLRAPGP